MCLGGGEKVGRLKRKVEIGEKIKEKEKRKRRV